MTSLFFRFYFSYFLDIDGFHRFRDQETGGEVVDAAEKH